MAEDALFGGALRVLQPARGYRVNVDTLILADFTARARPRIGNLLDLGAGVGALGLAVRHFATVRRLDFVEREAPLAELSRTNLSLAGAEGTVHAIDVAEGLPARLRGTAHAVVVNPPFFAARDPSAPGTLRARARQGDVAGFLRAASLALGRRGAAFFVYPAPALPEFVDAARKASLVAKRMRFVHAFADSPARVLLIELRHAKPGGVVVEPPLVEWASAGVRSAALSAIVAGERPDA